MNWTDPTPEMIAEWNEWRTDPDRPADMQAVAARFEPWAMYRLRETGQRCMVLAFSESGEGHGVTCRVYAEHETLGPITGVEVFGIDPDNLEPWTGSERSDWNVTRWPG